MSKFRGNAEEIKRYYGDRKYKQMINQLQKQDYTQEQKIGMLKDIQKYINAKNYDMYHDLMDDICESNPDWFNLLVFNKNERGCILEYIRSKVRSKNNKM